MRRDSWSMFGVFGHALALVLAAGVAAPPAARAQAGASPTDHEGMVEPPTPHSRGMRFGEAVAVSPFRNELVVGAPGVLGGEIYYFTLQPGGAWTRYGENGGSAAGSSGRFGASLAWITVDTLLAGDPRGYASGGVTGMGEVKILTRNRNTGKFEHAGSLAQGGLVKGDNFGASLAFSSPYLAVGAPHPVAGGTGSGAVYVYRYQPSGATPASRWTLDVKLTPGAGSAGFQFGASVAIWGDILVVGAPNASFVRGGRTIRSGKVYVYARKGSPARWQLIGSVDAPTPPVSSPSLRAVSTRFGASVATDGGRVVVGAPNLPALVSKRNVGGIYIYKVDTAAGGITLEETVVGSKAYGYYGASLAMNAKLLLIGATRSSAARGGAGRMVAYKRDAASGIWKRVWIFDGKVSFDSLGFAVALGRGGTAHLAVAGAPGARRGFTAGVGEAHILRDVPPGANDFIADHLGTTTPAAGPQTLDLRICTARPATSPFGVQLMFDLPRSADPLSGLTFASSPTLAADLTNPAGGCQSFSLPVDGLPSGVYKTVLRVDGAGKLPESKETNNRKDLDLVVAPATADLKVTSWTVTTGAAGVTWKGTICQTGSRDARDVNVKIWLNRPFSITCPNVANTAADLEGRIDLDPGACVSFTLGPEPLPSGTYGSRLFVDADCQVVEADEANNTQVKTFIVP